MAATMLRSAASKIARASLHPRRLVGLEHGSRPSPGPALLPVPRSSFHPFSSSPSAGSTPPPPPTNNKDLLACNSRAPSELEKRAWARLKQESKEAAYVLMLTCLFCFGCNKLSSDTASREREKFKDDLIKDIKHELMIHETLDNHAAGQSMQTAEQVKEHYGHHDPQNKS